MTKRDVAHMPRVLLTDHPWEDLSIEQGILRAAGAQLVVGPIEAPSGQRVEEMVREVRPQAILTCWAPVSAAAIANAPDLRIVARLGVGLDNIDVKAAMSRGAFITNVPDYCTQDVADHAVALILSWLRGIVQFDRAAKQGLWQPESARFDRLADLTIGIVGYGRIGQAAAHRLGGFGCRVLAHSRSLRSGDETVEPVDLPTLCTQADVILLMVPLTSDTRHMIDDAFIAACRRRPLIVNVSRGPLVDNAALLRGLENGAIRGAALDVIEGEPIPPREIMVHPATVITPHIAFVSDAALTELRTRACEQVVAALGGLEPPNAVCL